MFGRRSWFLRGLVSALAIAMGAWGVSVPAYADTPAGAPAAPVAAGPDTVTADGLPTWQINGAVFQQVVVGNTAYAVGSFTQARPPGVAVGGAGSVAANNIFAFDIRTGNRVASFAHQLNGQALAIAASPDGSRIYVGGDFTSVNGVARGHVAAFDVATGALVAGWAPSTSGQVRAIQVTDSTVYVGGSYLAANGIARTNLAAFATANGALSPWAPAADGGFVWTMTLTPDRSALVVGGSFTTLNTVDAYGMGKVDLAGATQPWAATARIRTAGLNGAITSLRTDGSQIFGGGYAFGAGATFEGMFAADPATGAINWVNDCLGDTYDVYPFSGALYSVGHSHDCSVIGGFPDTKPRSVWYQALAHPLTANGLTMWRDQYGWDYTGLPKGGLLNWNPRLAFGSYTPSRQAAWTIVGSGDYLVLGGEFPSVNGIAQQGLVRFAKRPAAPRKMGPVYAPEFNPVISSYESGKVRLTFQALWDRDNPTLSYDVLRNGVRVGGIDDVPSTSWQLPGLTYVDEGLTPGSKHVYQLRARDNDGNVQFGVMSGQVTVSDGAAASSPYEQAVRSDGASHLWRLGDAAGATAARDAIGSADVRPESVTFGTGGAITGDPDGATSWTAPTSRLFSVAGETAPAATTVEAWVKTTSTAGGRIVGFGDYASGTSLNYDRVLYLDPAGRVNFTTVALGRVSVRGASPVNDGQWHHLAGSYGATGTSLYVDGRLVARDTSQTFNRSYPGYWRLGSDAVAALANKPTDQALVGDVDDVAIYPMALTPVQVAAHHRLGGRVTPPDAYTTAVMVNSPLLRWRLDEVGPAIAADESLNSHDAVTSGTISYAQPGALVGGGKAMEFKGKGGYVIDQTPVVNPQVYSAEVWFKTAANTLGGKLIGFGNAKSGVSTSYDRHVYLTDAGRLRFGVYSGRQIVIESPRSYNDQQWHHVVATQGPDGMRLYVDGVLTAANAVSAAQSYNGYWRLAQDTSWTGGTNRYFLGLLDEAAVYPTALTLADVRAHYLAGSGRVANLPPVPAFTVAQSALRGTFDASASTDADGTIASYAWTFGDGKTGTGPLATHDYTKAGTYQVTLTVTDDQGAIVSITQTVIATTPKAPTAAFTQTVRTLSVDLDATSSTDPDGDIASYAWDFGDGTTGSGVTTTHRYASPGTFRVTLVVRDAAGLSSTTSRTVTAVANTAPTARLTTATTQQTLYVDGSASSDGDGTIVAYAWDFGDGTTGTGRTASHTYAAGGPYTVTLTVTDNDGATSSATAAPLTIAANQPPTAAFTSSQDRFALAVDGTTSADPDGAVVSYAWTFGDGATATGPAASHTYAAVGSYEVTLTVVDDQGVPASATRTIVISDNHRPVASFSTTTDRLSASFDASASTDAEGPIADYAWDFGDGATGSGPSATHTYADAGSYLVTLTVTDADGAVSAPLSRTVVVASNHVPTASFTLSRDRLAVSVDASASSDAEGPVASYAWDFGDGATDTGVTATHTYAADGTYVVSLTVTDGDGATSSAVTQSVTVVGNHAPTASFTASVAGLVASVDASASSDAEGPIALFAWDFGDGATGTGATSTHTYAADGTYVVSLTVTDGDGLASAPVTRSLTVAGNKPPTAAFTATPSRLAVSVDGSASADVDGTVAAYAWTFGDGSTGSGVSAAHTYASGGTYDVTLTVTDNEGASSTVATRSVIVAGNQAPTAAFSQTANRLIVDVDGSASADADGTISTYAWDFGDGGTGSGASASHTYAAAGAYTVRLTVTDDNGTTATTTRQVSVSAALVYAKDTFQRSVTGQWGTADLGGAWTHTGLGTRWSVDGSAGALSLGAGSGYTSTLAIAKADTDTVLQFWTDKAPGTGGQSVSLISRSISGVGDYRAMIRLNQGGTVSVWLNRTVGTTTTVLNSLAVPNLSYTLGDVMQARFQVNGAAPTTLKVKLWKSGTSEPSSWTLTTTDTTAALAAPGAFGMYTYLSGSATNAPVVFRFDNLAVSEVINP